MTSRIPPEVLALLDASLGSYEKLELALYLTQAGAPASLAELQTALRLDGDSLREVIAELRAAKIVQVDGTPDSKVGLGPRARQEDFRTLMALYAEDRLPVVAALSSIAMYRIRNMAARSFAEAFVLNVMKKPRKDDDDG